MTEEQKSSALSRWYDKYDGRGDHPSISVWMSTALPSAFLQTNNNGCNQPETLPDGPAVAYVNISSVRFGGYLDDLELLFEAVREQLEDARAYHDKLRAAEVES